MVKLREGGEREWEQRENAREGVSEGGREDGTGSRENRGR